MSNRNWLENQIDQARQEVDSWTEWKREAMRREATSISSGREAPPVDSEPGGLAASGEVRSEPVPPKE
jgi:hypothetical protein